MSETINSDKTLKLLKLIEETGTSIEQKNGQRRYGPRPGATAPPRGSEVFVARLPRDCFEDEIVPVFSKFEPIYEMRLLMDFSGSNRGYAFIKYDSPEAARRVIQRLDGYEIRPGRRVGVVISLDNCRLYLGGLPRKLTRDELWQEVTSRVEGVTEVVMYPDFQDRSKNRGYAFVQLESHRLASLARRRLVGQLCIHDQPINVDWAEPEHSVSPHVLKKVRVLHVRNMLMETTGAALKDAVEAAVGCTVLRVKKIKNYAFVHFSTRCDAQLAFQKLKETDLDGQKLEVSWAKPVADRFQYAMQKQCRATGRTSEATMHKYNMCLYNWHVIEQVEREKAPDGSGPPPCPEPAPAPTARASAVGYTLAPYRLDAVCTRYHWETPQYKCLQLQDNVHWVGTVRLPCVFHPNAPYLKQELCTGYTAPCGSISEAYVEAAQAAIDLLKVFRDQPYQPAWTPIPVVSSQYVTPQPVAASPRAH